MHNVLQKPIEMIFNEFNHVATDEEGAGDVKYHLGMSSDVVCESGKSMHLSLLANPSHLETASPFFILVDNVTVLSLGLCAESERFDELLCVVFVL